MDSDTKFLMGAVSPVTMEALPSAVLARYQQARVTVHYNTQSGFNDTGTITFIDNHWVELTKDNAERLLIPVASIRILKLLGAARLEGDAGSLLRPLENRPENEPRQMTK